MNYEKLLDKAKEAYNNCATDAEKRRLETIFPELKESEDERMRKEIIQYIKDLNRGGYLESKYSTDWIAWLEKQPEKKPFFDERIIADVFEEAGLAKIVREQKNDDLTNAVQAAMIKLAQMSGPNPYTGVSFDFNGHTWGMSAADGGVEISRDGMLIGSFNPTKEGNTATNADDNTKKDIMLAIESVATRIFKNTCSKPEWYDKARAWLEKQVNPEDNTVDVGEISDGYHTFNELYYYRMLYNAAFFNTLPRNMVYKSKRHHDGEECFGGGWFVVVANLPTSQISNHYELKDWDLFHIPEKEVADEWDGHTPQQAAERLRKHICLFWRSH